MSIWTEVLQPVLERAIPVIRRLTDPLPGQLDSAAWSKLEDTIGDIYGSILRSITPDSHVTRRLPFFSGVERNAFGAQITFGAINHRGLFRKNGRKTILEPCSSFVPRVDDEKRHDALHSVYMLLVGKAESINQLFLRTTRFRSLSVIFGDPGASLVEITSDPMHDVSRQDITLRVTKDLTNLLAPPRVRQAWQQAIQHVLAGRDLEPHDVATSARRGRLPAPLSFPEEGRSALSPVDEIEALRKNPGLFDEWLKLYPTLASVETAGLLFRSWLHSLRWLTFYCQEAVAGRFFYTVRLPPIIDNPKDVLPETSLSLVTRDRLSDDQYAALVGAKEAFSSSASFSELRTMARSALDKYRFHRLGQHLSRSDLEWSGKSHVDRQAIPSTGLPGDFRKLWWILNAMALSKLLERLYQNPEDLPIDFERLRFLLQVARRLVSRSHEGIPLRFCFIYGFGYERVDAESEGLLREFGADLRGRWQRYWSTVKSSEQYAGRDLASWIKANDLQLQRPDVAVYFEETADSPIPVPTSVVQIRHAIAGELHAVSTELQLRQALRRLSVGSRRTIGVLTAKTGLFVFILGKCLLIRCSGTEEWDAPLDLQLSDGGELLEEQTRSELRALFERVFRGRVKAARRAAAYVLDLAEALVSMSHGAMFIIRPSETNEDDVAALPLNPVWLLRSHIDKNGLGHECAIYALMSALDGATEILLPRDDAAVQFRCRRFAQTTRANWVWIDDDEEPGHALLAPRVSRALRATELVGKGTRHHTALVLSRDLGSKALVITVSGDGPVTIYRNGTEESLPTVKRISVAP